MEKIFYPMKIYTFFKIVKNTFSNKKLILKQL